MHYESEEEYNDAMNAMAYAEAEAQSAAAQAEAEHDLQIDEEIAGLQSQIKEHFEAIEKLTERISVLQTQWSTYLHTPEPPK